MGGKPLVALVEASLAAGAEARFEADGRSMLPLIRPGDVLSLRRLGEGALRSGDVVAIRGMPGDGLLVHRVVRWKDGKALIRGDNTAVANGEFAQGDALGIVCAVERDGREVWFGAGRLGGLVAWGVRSGLVWRVNRVVYGARRRARACLKFLALASRLREHKGDDGNE